jgi:hypothetical protein
MAPPTTGSAAEARLRASLSATPRVTKEPAARVSKCLMIEAKKNGIKHLQI